jgi:peptidyl-prolyl cis-trans isomerase A (cyclophilin A)
MSHPRTQTRIVFCALALGLFPLAAKAETIKVDLITSVGTIGLDLDSEKAPKSVANFLAYAKSGHYDGTIFHRVIADFMIQGGGLDAKLTEKKTTAPIPNESKNGLSNLHYTIAMARTADPHSATSQFFINVRDNPELDAANSGDGWGYAVFGKVTTGQDIVDKIKTVATRPRGISHEHVPVDPIVIQQVVIHSPTSP